MRFTLAIVLYFTAATLNAQDQYIVKLNGDTIRGKLLINPMRDNTQSIYFRHPDGNKENLRPIRVTYVYYDEEYQFRSIPFYNQRLFMHVVKEDRNLSYYHYIHKRDNSIATTKVFAKPNGDALELSALSFKKQVSEFLDDCPQVNARIEAKEYKYKDIDQLFEDYNNCDIQTVSASSTQTNSPANSAVATMEAGDHDNMENPGPATTKKQDKLAQIDAFRKYVRDLDDFQHARDVLEWLTDIEYRVSQDREIPNYLWNSLDAMTASNDTVQEQALELRKKLQD
jgi:hypothetical protein